MVASMLDDFSLWSVLTIIRSALLTACVCALAAWAVRLPDQHSELLKKLTKRNGKCVAD
jgi:hypothetical protein